MPRKTAPADIGNSGNARTKRRYKPRIHGDWRPAFLKQYRDLGTIIAACEVVGVSRPTVYNERQRNEEFAVAFADAEEAITEGLEGEARRRAMDGSDRLLEFLLKARRPEKYSENHRMIHSGSVDSRVVLTPEQEAAELAAFGMQAAIAVAAGPEAIEPPEDA